VFRSSWPATYLIIMRSRRGPPLLTRRAPSTACWPVLSLQVGSGGLFSQYAPDGPSSGRWNDCKTAQWFADDPGRATARVRTGRLGGACRSLERCAAPAPSSPACPPRPRLGSPQDGGKSDRCLSLIHARQPVSWGRVAGQAALTAVSHGMRMDADSAGIVVSTHLNWCLSQPSGLEEWWRRSPPAGMLSRSSRPEAAAAHPEAGEK
jgi:hypothetical protein